MHCTHHAMLGPKCCLSVSLTRRRLLHPWAVIQILSPYILTPSLHLNHLGGHCPTIELAASHHLTPASTCASYNGVIAYPTHPSNFRRLCHEPNRGCADVGLTSKTHVHLTGHMLVLIWLWDAIYFYVMIVLTWSWGATGANWMNHGIFWAIASLQGQASTASADKQHFTR